MSAEILFWASASLAFYVYAGYPLVLCLFRLLVPRPVSRRPIEPEVSILVAAYNEEAVIEAKIRNCLDLDYPPGKLEVVVVSDGSTDQTAAHAARLSGQGRVRVISHAENSGKLAVLNETIPQLRGEIVVLSDASSLLAPDSVRRLMAPFADPQVGAASGLYRVSKGDQPAGDLGKQENAYWKYETFLKRQESAVGSILGAHGALYALRKSLYPFPPPGLINDDYIIPVRILQQGYRVTYEPEAVAWESVQDLGGFRRRVRVMRGNLQQLREIRGFLWPPRLWPLFCIVSHKAGRLGVPLAMLVMAASNVFLLPQPGYLAIAALQAAFYVLVALGAGWRLQPRFLGLPYYFCMIHAAALLALCQTLAGRRQVAWK